MRLWTVLIAGGLVVSSLGLWGVAAGASMGPASSLSRGLSLTRGWTQLAPTHAPSNRAQVAMAYDPALGKVVLFGGYDSVRVNAVGQTWVFAGGQWKDISSKLLTSPPPRWGAGFVYDPILQGMVLFGGRTYAHFHNDTWLFNNTGWYQYSPSTAPSPRNGGSLVWDPIAQDVLLVGGGKLNLHTGSWTYYNDTWTFKGGGQGASWTRTGNAPFTPTWGPHLFYDPVAGKITSFGGGFLVNGTQVPGGNLTWTYSNGTWTRLSTSHSPPLWTGGGEIQWDPRRNASVLFGGQTGGTPTQDTWKYVNGSWTNLTGRVGVQPGARSLEGLTYDALDGYILVFGGTTAPPNYAYWGDTWAFT